jgi:hypothetical protein
MRHQFRVSSSQIATLLIKKVLLVCALKVWQSQKCQCKLFLADYDSSYFVPLEVIEKFFESDML